MLRSLQSIRRGLLISCGENPSPQILCDGVLSPKISFASVYSSIFLKKVKRHLRRREDEKTLEKKKQSKIPRVLAWPKP
jgi:hypothetical protein